jgi:hypothetical protein
VTLSFARFATIEECGFEATCVIWLRMVVTRGQRNRLPGNAEDAPLSRERRPIVKASLENAKLPERGHVTERSRSASMRNVRLSQSLTERKASETTWGRSWESDIPTGIRIGGSRAAGESRNRES